jgi:hypothetical protein
LAALYEHRQRFGTAAGAAYLSINEAMTGELQPDDVQQLDKQHLGQRLFACG